MQLRSSTRRGDEEAAQASHRFSNHGFVVIDPKANLNVVTARRRTFYTAYRICCRMNKGIPELRLCKLSFAEQFGDISRRY